MVKSVLNDILSEYLKGHNQAVTSRASIYQQQYRVIIFTSVTVCESVYSLERKAASMAPQNDGLRSFL